MTDYREQIKSYLAYEQATLAALDIESINQALNVLEGAYERGSTVYIFGNGGSSATASHYQNDFNKGVSETLEKKFDFRCLNDNIATVMAVANDIGFEEVFRYQLRGHLKAGDVVMAISGSGNSANVVLAAEYAKEQGNEVIGITGYDGGKLRKLCDVSLHAPINSMQVTEDIHMIFDHLMMSVMCKSLAGIDHCKE